MLNNKLVAQISIYDAIKTGKEISKNDKNLDKLPAKLVQTLGIEVALPDRINYHFNNGSGEVLRSRLSFALFYTINYPIFKKVTLGIVVGVQHQSQGSITGLKLGAVLRYYFKNYESANFYFMVARSIGVFGKVDTSSGYGNAKFGLEFPIEKNDDIHVLFSIFWDNDSYKLKTPLLENEIPEDIRYHQGYGLGIGIQF